jgi:uncharacterized membrane protein
MERQMLFRSFWGTIAFISGIYQELIGRLMKLWISKGLKGRICGCLTLTISNFRRSFFLGIAISVLSLANNFLFIRYVSHQ